MHACFFLCLHCYEVDMVILFNFFGAFSFLLFWPFRNLLSQPFGSEPLQIALFQFTCLHASGSNIRWVVIGWTIPPMLLGCQSQISLTRLFTNCFHSSQFSIQNRAVLLSNHSVTSSISLCDTNAFFTVVDSFAKILAEVSSSLGMVSFFTGATRGFAASKFEYTPDV